MPRITVEGGPSNAAALPGEVGHMPPAEDGAVAAPEGWTEVAPADVPHEARAPIVEEPVTPQDAPDYVSLTQAELRAEAKSRELPAGGSKADLAARLAEHDAAQLPAEAQAVLAEGGD